MWCIYKNEADSIFCQKLHLSKMSHVWEKQTHGCIILMHRHFHVNWFPNVLGSGHSGNRTCVIKLWIQRRFKPQSLQFYRPKHILSRQKRKWVGAFTWITWNSWGKKVVSTQYKYPSELLCHSKRLWANKYDRCGAAAAAGAGRPVLC